MKAVYIISVILIIIFSCNESKSKKVKKRNNKVKQHIIKSNNYSVVQNKTNAFQIFPINESKFDKSLEKFISNLKNSVAKKDTSFLYNSIDDSIVVSYGGAMYGKSDFIENWDLKNFRTSKIWSTLGKLLNLGGTKESDEEFGEHFSIPYYQSKKLLKKIPYTFDWYFTAVCIFPETKIYEKPSDKSNVIAKLNYEIIEIIPEFKYSSYPKIKILSQNKIGFVHLNQIMFSAEQTIILKKKNNEWKIVSFAPFD